MYFDLSVTINDQTPVYPGDPVTKIEPAGVMERDGYTDHYLSIGTHVGTHVDAPAHMIVGGKTLKDLPIDAFIGRGRYIKVENKKFDLNVVKQAGIEKGDIVLFHTGLDKIYKDAAYFEDYPTLPGDVARYLVSEKVKIVGFDMCSPDHDTFTTHKILLGSNILIIENLTGLERLAGKDFTVYALPIKLEVDGSPARVIAEVAS